MADIPTVEPSEIIAGDTLKFQKSLSDYSSSTWTLTYYLLKSGTQITFSASASGTDHLVNVSNTTTAGWAAGIYKWESYISKTGERYKISSGTIEIKPNLAAQTTGYDARSHVKKVLDAIEAVIEGRASRTDLSYTINDRTIQHMGPEELIKWHSHYKKLYMQELQAEKIKQGLTPDSKVLVRFNSL